MTTSTVSDAPLVNASDAARLLGIKAQTLAVWRLTARYPLAFVRVGRSIRYSRADIDTFIRARRVAPVAVVS
jgi:excisionase family DNA binding protein